jgi:RNAse (barnase) inhibitor barstar
MQLPRWLAVTADPAPAAVDGRACRTRAAFFDQVARALGFPSYFGRNWDALVDCLRDVGAVELTVAHAEDLLADESLGQLAVLLDVMATAAADGLTLSLRAEAGHEATLRERVEAALRSGRVSGPGSPPGAG